MSAPIPTRVRFLRRVAFALAFSAILMLPGCLNVHSWEPKDRPWTRSTIDESAQVRIERADGSQMTLEHARIENDDRGTFLAGRIPGGGAREVRMELTDIRTLEVRELDAGKLAAAIAAGIVVLAAIYFFVFEPFIPSG